MTSKSDDVKPDRRRGFRRLLNVVRATIIAACAFYVRGGLIF